MPLFVKNILLGIYWFPGTEWVLEINTQASKYEQSHPIVTGAIKEFGRNIWRGYGGGVLRYMQQ